MRTSRTPRSPRLLVPTLLAALAACATPPPLPPGADNPGLRTGELYSVNPLDVAVLPVENQTSHGDLPLESLRRHFHAGLVERHYSPLALDFVDGKATEASYQPGAADEHAILKVVVTGWDDHLWRSHARLVIDADLWLMDATRPSTDQALWGGHVSRTMEMGRLREVTAGDGPLLERAVSDFVDQVLVSLPTRKPELASAR